RRRGSLLHQSAKDTIDQAVGKVPIPPTYVPNDESTEDFEAAAEALRYGFGASGELSEYEEWDVALEERLQNDWDSLRPGREWSAVKDHVRLGWERARK